MPSAVAKALPSAMQQSSAVWWSSTVRTLWSIYALHLRFVVPKRTVQVALAVKGHAPASVLGKSVEHVVQEANASVDGDPLGAAGLRGMALKNLEESGVGIRRQFAAIEADGKLNLGLVGIAGERGPARSNSLGSHGVSFSWGSFV